MFHKFEDEHNEKKLSKEDICYAILDYQFYNISLMEKEEIEEWVEKWFEDYFEKKAKKLEEQKREEEEIPFTLGSIKAICGWGKFCDVTGGNHYMLKEFTVEGIEVFYVKRKHAKQLGLILSN